MAQDVQLVIFKLANEDYGLPIQKVQEINRMVPVTKLPQTPEFMEGIINLRGRVIPVVDLRKRFGLAVKPHEDDTRIMIIDIDGQTVGIIVDAVNEVVDALGAREKRREKRARRSNCRRRPSFWKRNISKESAKWKIVWSFC